MRKIIACLMAVLLMVISAQAATIYGSLPDDRIYVEQNQKHTCTLVAATMMMRNYAFQNGCDFTSIDISQMQKICWSSYGLAQEFKFGNVAVTHNPDISSASDKKQYLIDQLKVHPEGFVIYNAKQPHAVFLFGYRADIDMFFCADTTGKNSLQMISLADTLLAGEGQQGKIEGLTKIWHIQ